MAKLTGDVPGVTICPSCGTDLVPADSSGDPPVQEITQACTDCSYEATVGLVWYKSTNYDVAGKIDGDVDRECERCSSDVEYAVIGLQRGVAQWYCSSCVPPHNAVSVPEIGATQS